MSINILITTGYQYFQNDIPLNHFSQYVVVFYIYDVIVYTFRNFPPKLFNFHFSLIIQIVALLTTFNYHPKRLLTSEPEIKDCLVCYHMCQQTLGHLVQYVRHRVFVRAHRVMRCQRVEICARHFSLLGWNSHATTVYYHWCSCPVS